MPDTRELRALKAVESTLSGHAEKPEDLNVHRFTFRAIEKDKLPSLVPHNAGHPDPSDRGGTLVEKEMDIALAMNVQGNQTEPPDDVIEPYLSWITQALMEDPTLGGAVTLLKMGRREPTESIETDRVYVRVVQHVRATLHHRRDNPELDS